MNPQPFRMMDDPSEPDIVRELLQAGSADEVSGYDYEKGLNQHLALVAAGALPPAWATKGTTSLSKLAIGSSIKTATLWIGLPVASAGIIAAVLLTGNETPRVTEGNSVTATAKPTLVEEKVERAREASPINIEREQRASSQKVVIPAKTPRQTPAESYHARHNAKAEPVAVSSAKGRSAVSAVGKRSADQIARADLSTNPYKAKLLEKSSGSAEATTPLSRSDAVNSVDPTGVSRQHAQQPRLQTPQAADIGAEKPEEAKIPFSVQPYAEVEQKKVERKKEEPYEREMRLLAAANRVLHSDAQKALELTQSGEREFAEGMFAEERRHLLVLALVKLGRNDEARRIGLKYLRQYPKGPFSERVRRALATGQVPEE